MWNLIGIFLNGWSCMQPKKKEETKKKEERKKIHVKIILIFFCFFEQQILFSKKDVLTNAIHNTRMIQEMEPQIQQDHHLSLFHECSLKLNFLISQKVRLIHSHTRRNSLTPFPLLTLVWLWAKKNTTHTVESRVSRNKWKVRVVVDIHVSFHGRDDKKQQTKNKFYKPSFNFSKFACATRTVGISFCAIWTKFCEMSRPTMLYYWS